MSKPADDADAEVAKPEVAAVVAAPRPTARKSSAAPPPKPAVAAVAAAPTAPTAPTAAPVPAAKPRRQSHLRSLHRSLLVGPLENTASGCESPLAGDHVMNETGL